jgi:hypothetical protein
MLLQMGWMRCSPVPTRSRLCLAGALVVALVVAGALVTPPAAAAPPAGTNKFTAPAYVPNYFSNEIGRAGGRTAATAHDAEAAHAAPVSPALRAPEGARRIANAQRRHGNIRAHAGRSGHRLAVAAARGSRRGTRLRIAAHTVRRPQRTTAMRHALAAHHVRATRPIAARNSGARSVRRHAARAG